MKERRQCAAESRICCEEKGVVEIEGMIIMTILIFLLVFLMSFGFLLYQRWMVSVVANDTAFRIGQSYVYSTTDPVMGFLKDSVKKSVSPFRYTFLDGRNLVLHLQNKKKAENYALWDLSISRLAYTAKKPIVKYDVVYDAFAQRHVVVDITADYEIPFGGALEYFGLKKTVTFHATGRSFCHDISHTVYTIKQMEECMDILTKNIPVASDALKVIDKVAKFITDFSEYKKDHKENQKTEN